MDRKASVTVMRPPDELERLWQDSRFRHAHVDSENAEVRFIPAPGGRGTEIHVELRPSGGIGQALRRLTGTVALARVKDDLRRFKQQVETGIIPRSEAVPEGELLERKFKRRPAQPLSQREREEVGV